MPKLTKDELLERLRECAQDSDREAAHGAADEALLDYIDDFEITDTYNEVDKWYA